MKKIIKGITTHTIAFVLGAIIFTIIGAYAATALASSDVQYDNKTSGSTKTTVQDAIDDLYNLADTTEFKVGDYVKMTPTKTSFTVSKTLTGYSSDQTINPSELNLWRVIKINSNNTVEMVSQNVSSVTIYFSGVTGYTNFVGTLNYIAKQYENTNYTVASRHMGYNGQTEYISNTSNLNLATPAWTTTETSNNTNEAVGGGDILYGVDQGLVETAIGTLVANKVGKTSSDIYWLASRNCWYYGANNWGCNGRLINTVGILDSNNLVLRNSSGTNDQTRYNTIRPIITLKSKIKAEGSGTSTDPYVLK